MNIIRDGKEITLTDKEIEAAYRIQELRYKTQDMKNTCEGLGIHGLDSGDYEVLAERYLDNIDCNLSENSQEENLALNYVREAMGDGRSDVYLE